MTAVQPVGYTLGTPHAPGVMPLPEPTAVDLAPYLPMLSECVYAFMAARFGADFHSRLDRARCNAEAAPSLPVLTALRVAAPSAALSGARTTRGPDATSYADVTGAGVAA